MIQLIRIGRAQFLLLSEGLGATVIIATKNPTVRKVSRASIDTTAWKISGKKMLLSKLLGFAWFPLACEQSASLAMG